MTTWINPYLDFPGTCREAFEFYADVFGGKLDVLTAAEMGVPEIAPERIMHAHLETADGWTIMGADCDEGSEEDSSGLVSRCTLTIGGVDADLPKAQQWFAQLAAGGQALMDLAPQMWGSTYGQVRDKYGVTWAFNIGGEE